MFKPREGQCWLFVIFLGVSDLEKSKSRLAVRCYINISKFKTRALEAFEDMVFLPVLKIFYSARFFLNDFKA